MPVIRLAGFAGENRAIHPKLLPDAVGVVSRNQKPGRGDLRPWKQPVTVANVPSGRQTIYRFGRDVASDSLYWLSWESVTHLARGFDPEDDSERTYLTNDDGPQVIDSLTALASTPYPTASRPLGLPQPTTPLLTTVVDPTAEVLQEGREAYTDVLVAPRQIVSFRVFDAGFLLPRRTVELIMTGTADISAGDTITVACTSHPELSGTVVVRAVLGIGGGSFGITYRPQTKLPKVASTPAVGTVTKSTDTVFYPAVERLIADLGDLGLRETRFYVYTYVNDWGWESAPSPVGLQADAYVSSRVDITGFDSPPSGNYQINRIRIYRTQSGSTTTEFFFLREIPIGTSTTEDDGRALGEVLPTTTWLPPPADLYQLTSLWNGMLAGISGNAVRFCEPYIPYAWPIAFDVVPPDSKPVALGVFGQALIVLTTGRPLLVTGSSPESMDQQLLEIPQACIAPRSVASMGTGVAWASEDGLCWYGSGGAKILTAGLLTREDWQALNPTSIIGRMYEGLYFGSYLDGATRRGFMIDPMNPQGVFFLDNGYEAMHFDELKDQLYVLSGGNVQKWDAGAAMTYRFRSKEFRVPRPVCFAAAEVVADAYPVTLRVFADGVLKHTQTVSSLNPFRLPSGFMAHTWQLEVEGTQPVQLVAMANAMLELAEA